MNQFKVFLMLFWGTAMILAQDDGKYVPDSIPVWEHERQDYTFSYGVKDLHTGDVKNQWEKKIGDTIHGHYSVLEPDGSLRIVHYTADEKNGFNAVVKHEGPSYHPVTVPTNHKKPSGKPKEETHEALALEGEAGAAGAEDTQSVKIDPEIEPETQTIDAYLFIPTGHQDEFLAHYKFLADKDAQPLKNYNQATNKKPTTIGYEFVTPLKPVTINFPRYLDGSNAPKQHHQQGFLKPDLEDDFQPIKKNKYSQPLNIPNTFTTNKRPTTTPGLKAYASDNHKSPSQSHKNNAIRGHVHQQNKHQRGPVQFPKRSEKIQPSPVQAKKNFIAYTKHVAYFPSDY